MTPENQFYHSLTSGVSALPLKWVAQIALCTLKWRFAVSIFMIMMLRLKSQFILIYSQIEIDLAIQTSTSFMML